MIDVCCLTKLWDINFQVTFSLQFLVQWQIRCLLIIIGFLAKPWLNIYKISVQASHSWWINVHFARTKTNFLLLRINLVLKSLLSVSMASMSDKSRRRIFVHRNEPSTAEGKAVFVTEDMTLVSLKKQAGMMIRVGSLFSMPSENSSPTYHHIHIQHRHFCSSCRRWQTGNKTTETSISW